MPDGSQMVDLEGRYKSFTMATINEDGTIGTTCITSKAELDEMVEMAKKALAEPVQEVAK
jgi:hypothetical protein